MAENDLPPDAESGREVARQVGMPYYTLRKWWQRGKVNSWTSGGKRYLSVDEVRRVWEDFKRVRHAGGPGAVWLGEPLGSSAP